MNKAKLVSSHDWKKTQRLKHWPHNSKRLFCCPFVHLILWRLHKCSFCALNQYQREREKTVWQELMSCFTDTNDVTLRIPSSPRSEDDAAWRPADVAEASDQHYNNVLCRAKGSWHKREIKRLTREFTADEGACAGEFHNITVNRFLTIHLNAWNKFHLTNYLWITITQRTAGTTWWTKRCCSPSTVVQNKPCKWEKVCFYTATSHRVLQNDALTQPCNDFCRRTAEFTSSTSGLPVFSTSIGFGSGCSTGRRSTCVMMKGFSEATIRPFPWGSTAA